jgi:glycerophosphoryl diester phosphodiesterase
MNMQLVAHRGEPENLPENSLEGYRTVLEAGARLLETDIQLTADGVPVLCHDPSLLRMTGLDLPVTHSGWEQIRHLPAGQPLQFGDRFPDARIARLKDFVTLLGQWPQAQAFVEIKQESLDVFGIETVVEQVLTQLAPAHDQCILISFNADVIARARGRIRTGWVLSEWSDTSHATAQRLTPDFLLINHKRLPPEPEALWPGPWQWAVYTVNTAAEIPALLARGVALIETNVIRTLLSAPFLTGTGHA